MWRPPSAMQPKLCCVCPDTHAHGRGEHMVGFSGRGELWGPDSDPAGELRVRSTELAARPHGHDH